MNDIYKHTNPTWDEVLTEQENNIKFSCSGNSREDILRCTIEKKYPEYKEYIKYMDVKMLYWYEYKLENWKLLKKLERIEKFGYPKKCPAIKHITNLIIF